MKVKQIRKMGFSEEVKRLDADAFKARMKSLLTTEEIEHYTTELGLKKIPAAVGRGRGRDAEALTTEE